MQQPLPPRFVVNPDDPRAPPQGVWDSLSEAERRAVVAALPVEVPLDLHPPEGDLHRKRKNEALDALERYFRSIGRRIYVSVELATYYPDTTRFCPDLLSVLDVDDHPRDSWVVSHEGKGLDLVLEIHWKGDEEKDLVRNVRWYAELGISEYFVFDMRRQRLLGYQLPSPGDRAYQSLVPQQGRWPSRVLGLDLALEDGGIKFYAGTAALPGAEELIAKLKGMLEGVVDKQSAALDRALQAEARAEQERKAKEEALQRAERLAAQLRAAGIEPDAPATPPGLGGEPGRRGSSG